MKPQNVLKACFGSRGNGRHENAELQELNVYVYVPRELNLLCSVYNVSRKKQGSVIRAYYPRQQSLDDRIVGKVAECCGLRILFIVCFSVWLWHTHRAALYFLVRLQCV